MLEVTIHARDGLELVHTDDTAQFAQSLDLSLVPTAPGCYIMFDERHKPIYIGKANNLRNRLRSYVTERDTRYSVKFLMRRVTRVEFLVTSTEKEALLLENSLIKQHKPRYNVRLKDDKTYISLRIDPRQDFPRLTVVRRYKKDGARYFGPYTSAKGARDTLRQVLRMFALRRCSDSAMAGRIRPCLYHQMKQCHAPCTKLITRDAYHDLVRQLIMTLDGRTADLEKELLAQIAQLSENLEFEKAALQRDRLFALRQTLERQRTAAVPGAEDRDVFGIHSQGRVTEIQILHFRGGLMLGGRSFSFEQTEMPPEELLGSLMLQYYLEVPEIPPEILAPIPLEEASTLADLLSEQRNARVSLLYPQRGEKVALVELANRNARTSFDKKQLAETAARDLLEQVRAKLGLSRLPIRIECYDISNLQGTRAVGAGVAFENAEPAKSRYRRYSIRSVEGQDDFAMMREVLTRRFTRAAAESPDLLPNLILIDGGKGQLNAARAALQDMNVNNVELASIAKSRLEEDARSPERFFTPGRVNPIILPQDSPVVKYLARIRDEAHRFAITFHRTRRKKETLRTTLLSVPGIGKIKARQLLNMVGSIAKIKECSPEELAAVPGIGPRLARDILTALGAGGFPSTEGNEGERS